MGEDLARASVSFFAIIDPLGNMLVFYLLTRSLGLGAKARTAAISVSVAFALLVVFTVGGREVLEFLDISAESFQIAAGLLLLLPAFRLVMQGEPMSEGERETLEPSQLAIVPLAMPLLAGPGALAAAISFGDTAGVGTTVLAVALVLALAFVAFVASDWLFALAGRSVLRLVSRIVGVLLFAIAVDFVLEGSRAFFDL